MRLAISLVAVLALTACTSSAANEELVRRTWTLETVAGFNTMPSGVETPTIRFAPDGHFSGNTGCNNGGASYRIESGDRLVIEPMITTKRACANPDGNALERAYVGAIEKTRSFRIDGARLELLDGTGNVVARFR